jgi:undecaprenyl pyrophosphate phosphatase UppP
LIVGAVVSFLVGLRCLRWLIAFVVQRSLNSFIIYLVVMAVLTLLWQFFAPGLFVTA